MDLDHAVCMDSNLSESSLMDVQGEYFQFVMSIAQFLSITNIDLKPYRETGIYKHFKKHQNATFIASNSR